MNEQQEKLIRIQQNILEKYITEILLQEKNPTKRNEHWGNVTGFMAVVSGISKEHESEARRAMWDITDRYEGQNNG